MEERFKQLLAWKKSFEYMAEMLSKEYDKNITPEIRGVVERIQKEFTVEADNKQ